MRKKIVSYNETEKENQKEDLYLFKDLNSNLWKPHCAPETLYVFNLLYIIFATQVTN